MPNFTTELRAILFKEYGDAIDNYLDPESGIECPDKFKVIGLHNYPIFDEAYRNELNQKIIRHYYMREIGVETEYIFKLFLNRRMWEQATVFNENYKASLKQADIDPMTTLKMVATMKGTGTTTQTDSTTIAGTSKNVDHATNESSVDGKSTAVNSAFPQSRLSNDEEYATSSAESESTTTTTGTADNTSNGETSTQSNGNATGESTTDTISETSGYSGNPGDLITNFRQAIVNTDMLVIDSLADLFMAVWDSNDEFFHRRNPYGGFYYGIYGFPYGF